MHPDGLHASPSQTPILPSGTLNYFYFEIGLYSKIKTMRILSLSLALFCICSITASAQTSVKSLSLKTKRFSIYRLPASKVDFDAFDSLTKEVKEYRKDRLVHLEEFLSMSAEKNTIILDTRSTEMYNRKHVKGAVHLDFSDFTQANLAKVVPTTGTRILIYCNNNFADDEINFVTKSARPIYSPTERFLKGKEITLALNIPTFINLYGYGYKNVYELGDLVSVFMDPIKFEGTDFKK